MSQYVNGIVYPHTNGAKMFKYISVKHRVIAPFQLSPRNVSAAACLSLWSIHFDFQTSHSSTSCLRAWYVCLDVAFSNTHGQTFLTLDQASYSHGCEGRDSIDHRSHNSQHSSLRKFLNNFWTRLTRPPSPYSLLFDIWSHERAATRVQLN